MGRGFRGYPGRRTGIGVLIAVLAGLTSAPAALASASPGAGPGSRRILVGFAPGQAAAARSLVEAVGGRAVSTIDDIDVHVVSVPTGRGGAVEDALRRSPLVTFVEPDGTVEPADVTPNDPYFPTGTGSLSGGEWGSFKTQAPQAWSTTTGSSAVTIAIIDSGIAAAHPDLAGKVISGWNVLTGTTDTNDTYGHGTEVAGVVGAASNNGQGIAAYCWACKLMPVKVYNSTSATLSDLASGVTWAADHGARVLNISMAGTSSSSTLANAVSYAQQKGAVVVAAAGNSGCNCVNYPAGYPGVVGVAGSDQTDTLYSYSDYGNWVPIAAPGANITTTLTDPKTGAQWGYMPVGGTSLAAPVVAGIAGLLFSTNSGASASSVTNALYSSVDPVNGTNKVAYGRVNAYKALVAFGAAAPPTSQPPASTAPPAISGTAQQGQTLSASTGTWANSPTAYAYQWKRCASDGTACSAITGATTQTYLLGSADVGSALVVAVTASNSAGSATAVSAPTAPVAATPAPPANTAPPAISGTAQQAQTLSASTGSWSGSPTAFAYQWERCAADGTACSAVAGATGQTYLLGSADVASALVVAVTASNTAGSATATSASTAPVSGAVATQTFSGSLNKKNTTASFPATVGAGSAQASASFSAKCSSLTLTVLTSTGTVVGQSSGPSVLSRTDTLAAGTYTYRVSGTCTTSVTLVVSAPAA